MYTKNNESVEKNCFEMSHVNNVVDEIEKNFNSYFDKFLNSEGGMSITPEAFASLQEKFGVDKVKKTSEIKKSDVFRKIMRKSIEDFEKDQQAYLDIFDLESLGEYAYEPHSFKSNILRNKCPIIRKTIQNKKAKVLDKYRADFNMADSFMLLDVVTNLCEFSERYFEEDYSRKEYENIADYQDLKLSDLDTDDYTAYGVIGGGIKSMMLYKVNPEVFPSRSRDALWALWYLTDKKDFGCTMDSEFLMIDIKKVITQQNYFYPYELFAFYALEIFKLIDKKATQMNVSIDREYRYVIVDAFLGFIADVHRTEIDLISAQEGENSYSYV